MALSGSVTTTSSYNRSVTLSWSASQSVANNTSTISWTLKGSGSASGWVRVSELRVKINGSQVYYRSSDNHTDCYSGTQLASGTTTISHNSDGTKTFSISVEAGIYQWAINCSGSGSFTLNTIPRASSISVGTLTMGTAGTITISRASSSFTHTISYAWGDTSASGISAGKGYKGTIVSKTTGTSVSWTPSLNLANVIPSATSGVGTLTCDTYSGSTKVGSKSITFTCNVPSSVKPSITSASVTVDNSANSVIAGWGLYVVGYSKAKITAVASGSYKSTISSFTISGGYSTTQTGTSLSYTGAKLTSSGSKTFNVVAKDSRGRSSDAKSAGTITVYAYSKPTVSSFTAERSSTDATKMVIKANWTFASVNSKNSATATLYYKRSSATGWTTYGTIAKNTSTTLTVDFAEEYSYNFRVIVKDAVGNSAQEETFVSTISVLLDFRAGGKGLGVGKIAETDAMEVALDAIFMGNIYIQTETSKITLADYIKSVMSG